MKLTILFTALVAHADMIWQYELHNEGSFFSYSSMRSGDVLALCLDHGINTYIYIIDDSGLMLYQSEALTTSNPVHFRSVDRDSVSYVFNDTTTSTTYTHSLSFSSPDDIEEVSVSGYAINLNPFSVPADYELSLIDGGLFLSKYSKSVIEVPLLSFSLDHNGNYFVRFESEIGNDYYIQDSPDLVNFADFTAPFTGNGDVVSYSFPYDPTRRFFRVVTKN